MSISSSDTAKNLFIKMTNTMIANRFLQSVGETKGFGSSVQDPLLKFTMKVVSELDRKLFEESNTVREKLSNEIQRIHSTPGLTQSQRLQLVNALVHIE